MISWVHKARKQGLLFCRKEAKDFPTPGSASLQDPVPANESFFGSFFSKKELLACLLCLAVPLASQAASPEGEGSLYAGVRYQDSLTYLDNPSRPPDIWDATKRIALGPATLSLGGELRERIETYTNPNFGFNKAPGHNTYDLHRLLLQADLRWGDQLRGFVQVSELQRLGVRGVTSTTDLDRLDLAQGFVDLAPWAGGPVLRAGRQELLLGFQRMVAVREGANARRSFDGLRLSQRFTDVTLDAFALRPVADKNAVFDDSPNLRQTLYGITATVALRPGVNADLYWLSVDNTAATFRGKTGHEQRDSFGLRLFGTAGGFDWNHEAALQTGMFRNLNISAWMLAAIAGYTFRDIAWEPRLALEANATSGDDPRHGTLATFNAPFPRLPYFAETSLLVPSNVYDLRPTLTVKPLPRVTVVAAWDTLWRTSTRDSLYGNGMVAYPNTSKAQGRRVGTELSLDARLQVDPHLTLGAIYAAFLAGEALTSVKGRDVSFLVGFATYKF